MKKDRTDKSGKLDVVVMICSSSSSSSSRKTSNKDSKILESKGVVPGKGQLLSVLDREKYSALVIEQHDPVEDEEEGIVNILIHHLTKTGERIGTPRWEVSLNSKMLSTLKYNILDLIANDEIEF